MAADIYLAYGQPIRLIARCRKQGNVLNDVTGASGYRMKLVGPDRRTTLTYTAHSGSGLTGGTVGDIYADIGDGDLNACGLWRATFYATISSLEYKTVHMIHIDVQPTVVEVAAGIAA